ncbi:thiamine pyrophosphate-dependent enzyme [Alkalihalobacillus deserti]|uniref:thiamine pyrophosphate-dependent enzyme n=1 Tax=Alkalihalobacillus deserti TaxID=2879466 RepID=UPI001D151C19|nr:thiamine pyrophosphate-dependent enzyme [Alkalihalobacillus deserti]
MSTFKIFELTIKRELKLRSIQSSTSRHAIGAKLALPEKPIVCLTGDRCMFIHGAEVSVAGNEEVPVNMISSRSNCVVFRKGRVLEHNMM